MMNSQNKQHFFNCGKPLIMGILNVTPDSFYDGGRYCSEALQIAQAEKMLTEGVDIIDLGGFSTKPGMRIISKEEELARLLPAIKALKSTFPSAVISIDTFRCSVAQKCIEAGADIINDISGGTFDSEMLPFVGSNHIPYILMHTTGSIETLHHDAIVDKNACEEVKQFFEKQCSVIEKYGNTDLVLDPGIGFGKSLEANYELLSGIEKYRINNLPVLIGISHKSLIYKPLQITPDEALNGTTVLNTIALLNGADILRVHDVKEAAEAIRLVELAKHKNV